MSYKWTRDVVTETARQEKKLNGETIVSTRDGYGALVEYYDLLDAAKDDVEESLKQFRQELELHGWEEMELTAKEIKEGAIRTATSAIELATIAWQVEDYLKSRAWLNEAYEKAREVFKYFLTEKEREDSDQEEEQNAK